ncbi:hypothetical protein [Plantactinospora sp. WMMB782]|uniref:hypothetical protein n=1 Tax=Plantactinospora sp. WMMB782 TaxID=3404121 RepID=UPI003B947E03
MPIRHNLARAAVGAVLAGFTVSSLATAAAAAPDGTDLVTAAYPVAPCVSGGPTSADSALATQLNSQLRAKMRGYMDAYRVSCARAVVAAVQARGLTSRAAVIAVTTTIVETGIRNISEEVDHDSLGLFQQRASWGSATNRLNPTWATNAFLNKMLQLYPNNSWQTAQIGAVCQAVQVSAYPDRYQPESGDAQIIVNALWNPARTGIYGVLSDRRLSYSLINSTTGDFVSIVKSSPLAFMPTTLATLNFNTLLVTSPAGELFRIDIRDNSGTLTYDPPVRLQTSGWTPDLLTYDGSGSLFAMTDGRLRRYSLTETKPTSGGVATYIDINGTFDWQTLTAAGPDWLLGTTSRGVLTSYLITGTGWHGGPLRSGWTHTHLISPGGGYYYGRVATGGMYHYRDRNPFDFDGSDIAYHSDDPVSTSGWSQVLLSAQPL